MNFDRRLKLLACGNWRGAQGVPLCGHIMNSYGTTMIGTENGVLL
jgi:hypothetical protein